jgi:diphthamide biosynthesis protein 2
MAALAEALPGTEGDAVARLNDLLDRLEAPRSLKELGMAEADVEKAATLAVKNSYWNPRKVEQGLLQELLRRAWAGEQARIDL